MTTSIYDNKTFLERVKDEFRGKYPNATLRLSQPQHPDHKAAACLWLGFKDGVEFAILEELREIGAIE